MAQSQRGFLVLFFKKELLSLPSDPDKAWDILPGYPDIGQFPVGKSGEFHCRGPLGPPGAKQFADRRADARMRCGTREAGLPGEDEAAKFAQRQLA
jgi:hypothetical protein